MFEEFIFGDQVSDEPDLLPIITMDDDENGETDHVVPAHLPILALKNTVLYPGSVIPITIGRPKSMKAIQKAYADNKIIGVLSQKDIKIEEPNGNDLYAIGTVARIMKMINMPDGSMTAILQGKTRFQLLEMLHEEPYLLGAVEAMKYEQVGNPIEFEALVVAVKDLAKNIIELSPNIPAEAVTILRNIKNDSFLLNFIASNLNLNIEKKQGLLSENNLENKARSILEYMNGELQILEIKDQIDSKVRVDIEKQQRDYFLNQQLKTIQEELGSNPQESEIQELISRSKAKKWPEDVQKAFDKQIERVGRINPQIAEYSVVLTYIELLLELPWEKYSKDNFDLKKVKKVLDQDHYGLEKVKDRILEHLAILKLKGDMKAPIICLVGPPGVGKTSLGKSIARALKRKFIRMSLGGLHDESEIRGHRKTYIGALPGRIIQSIKKAKTSNPVFILDEIDKLGKDFRGDPSSALLEVLDPEQNSTFYDNYLELEYDLSKVLFIATANSLNSIQPALRDRMEIIEISGYATEEKIQIAKKHLIPQQREAVGIKAKDAKLADPTIESIIQLYTRESGVRNLNRTIGAVLRHVAKNVAMEVKYQKNIKPEHLEKILGPSNFSRDIYKGINVPGVAVGLAWTRVGGDILFVESILSPGKAKLTLTGNLGDVMKESASTALSYIKAHASSIGIDPEKLANSDIHVHVPEGAIPKDGPSAGITILTALVSSFLGRKLNSGIAMTGEITLRGKVLPVGGIKEKILAAKRAGLDTIILCKENKKHIAEVNPSYIEGMKFIYVEEMKEVLNYALDLY